MKKVINKKKLILFTLILLIGLVLIYFSESMLSKDRYVQIKLKPLIQYGKPEDNKEEMFGLITSFTLDQYQNLYVADDAFKVVKKFSREGKFIRNFGYGAGKGPGEFSAIHGICVDSIENVYVLDKSNINITVFDSLNNLVSSLRTPFLPAQIIAVNPMTVDVSGFPFTYNGNLIHRYNLVNKNSDKPEMTYCKRTNSEDAKLGMLSGNSGRLVKSSSGNIYFSFFYPYEIHKFSSAGQYLSTIKGTRSLTAPYVNPNTGSIDSPSGVQEFVILPNDILLALTYESTNGEKEQFFDFFDGKNGMSLGSVQCKDLNLKNIRFLRTDIKGNLYLDVMYPYPHILKYSVELRFK